VRLKEYTLAEKRKAMIDAGHVTYASLARAIGFCPSVTRRVIVGETPIRMSRVEQAVMNEIGDYLARRDVG
jgi:hypothetical protein